jgi:hypothetical protein
LATTSVIRSTAARWIGATGLWASAELVCAEQRFGELEASGGVLPAAPGLSVLALLGLALLLFGVTRLRR